MAYQDANQNQSANTGPVSVKGPNIPSLIENFDPLIQRLEELGQRALASADRVLGSRPRDPSNSKNSDAPAPSHLVFAIQARRDRLSRAIEILESEIQRMEHGLT